jgi:hypothetical protein
VLHETYTPNQGPWVELPPPTSKHWDFGGRVGSLVYRINPMYLAYWNPDVAGRGFLFAGIGFGAIAFSFLVLLDASQLFVRHSFDDLLWLVVVSLMTAACALGVYLSARKPLPPPTYFNRKLQRVLQYQKTPGRKAEWLDWKWSEITPAVRQVHVYSTAGRSTMYVLVLMQLEPGTNKILKSFGAYTSVALKLPCVQAWEYMRRYMNEPPERVPAAYIPPFGFDPKTWAVRCQMESMQWGINPDGSFKTWFDHFFMPVAGTAIYPFIWATLWIEKTAPKIPLPPHIAELNEWDERQTNPYKIEHAWGGGEDGDPPLDQVFQRVKVRHRVMTVLGFGWFFGLLLLMLWSG